MAVEVVLPMQLGRYRLLSKLGAGGMGTVYLAEDGQLGRRVALKVPHFTDEDGPLVLERFVREARAAAAIDHPNLCPVFDAGQVEGVHYLTMPFIEGTPLSRLLGRPWEPERALALVRILALAVQVMHDRKIIHRDLKPSNVMIRTTGEPVVMDFGLARALADQTRRLTQTGAAVGTPAYMAPEQILGESRALGPATDVYALGVLLYELLAGGLPYTGPSAAIYGQILHAAPEPPSKRRPGLDERLDALCLKALAKEPAQRYRSMVEFAGAMEPLLLPATGLAQAGMTVEKTLAQGTHDLSWSKLPPPPASVPPFGGLDPTAPALPSTASRRPVFLAAGSALLAILVLIVWFLVRRGDDDKGTQPTPNDPDKDKNLVLDLGDGVKLELILVPAGKFLRGSPDGDKDAADDEKPLRQITIGKPFYLGKYEVTVAQFRAFVKNTGYKTDAEKDDDGGGGFNPATGKWEKGKEYTWKNSGFQQTDAHPVVNVSWNDAVAFGKWLSTKSGRDIRLPTEAEWEYSCRAGTMTRFHSGDDVKGLQAVANLADASFKKHRPAAWALDWDDGFPFTAPVGQFQANAFGLHDMHGNVWEWCADWYQSAYYKVSPERDPPGPPAGGDRVFRGGAFSTGSANSRAAFRNGTVPAHRLVDLGFRVACGAAPHNPDREKNLVLDLGENVKLELVPVPAGKFLRGDPDGDDDEKPRHEITLSKAFHLGKYEVTVGQFRAFVKDSGYKTDAEMGDGGIGYNALAKTWVKSKEYTWKNPGFPQTDQYPVVNMSWNDADAFCTWLRKKSGRDVRLPSEAEWEYSCRAGTATRFSCGENDQTLKAVANIADASFQQMFPAGFWAQKWNDGFPFTAPVGQFQANAFGLYDMHGNVLEWCGDWYKSNYYQFSPGRDPPGPGDGKSRVIRGGAFGNEPRQCRAAFRNGRLPSYRHPDLGFRVACWQ